MSTTPVTITRKYGRFTVQSLGSTGKAQKTVTSLEQNANVFILEDTEEALGQKQSGCRKSRRLPDSEDARAGLLRVTDKQRDSVGGISQALNN